MKEFLFAALPFVIMGLCVAVYVVIYNSSKEKNRKICITEGMCFGMCLGVTLSTIFDFNMGILICLGALVGELIGVCIEKREK